MITMLSYFLFFKQVAVLILSAISSHLPISMTSEHGYWCRSQRIHTVTTPLL